MVDNNGFTRTLGRSQITVSALGLGCWAIGGPFWRDDQPVGWGNVNDEESIAAIHRALELGVNFFDTASVYGCGHSERVLGKALLGRREQVVIATKFGQVFDEETRQTKGYDTSPEHVRRSCEDSLRRLNVDYIDLFLLHVKEVELDKALIIRDALESLVNQGKIRFYGWSTDNTQNSRFFAEGPHCTAIQQQLNIFEGNLETLQVCEQYNLASINRSPLGMGLLTGKFSLESKIPSDDVRSRRPALQAERAIRLGKLENIREILTRDGRTLAQGALGWLWARSAATIPIPGFKSIQQVEENIGAMHFGPLKADQMQEISTRLA